VANNLATPPTVHFSFYSKGRITGNVKRADIMERQDSWNRRRGETEAEMIKR
jgi:hypothetical protein